MKIPSRIVAGDTITWTDNAFWRQASPNDIWVSSGSYTLTYSFRGPSTGGALDLQATADPSGADWDLVLSATQSAAFNTGNMPATWWWQAYAALISAPSKKLLAGRGELVVEPNLSAISGVTYSGQSLSEQQLAAVRAEITARINNHARTEYTIGSGPGMRHLKLEPMGELLKLQTRLELQVAREKAAEIAANGLGAPNKQLIRFGGASSGGNRNSIWPWYGY